METDEPGAVEAPLQLFRGCLSEERERDRENDREIGKKRINAAKTVKTTSTQRQQAANENSVCSYKR